MTVIQLDQVLLERIGRVDTAGYNLRDAIEELTKGKPDSNPELVECMDDLVDAWGELKKVLNPAGR